MSPICNISGARGAFGSRGPDLPHMHLMYRAYTIIRKPCIGRYEVNTHATCLLDVTCLGARGAFGPRGPDLAHMHLMYRLYTTIIKA